MSATRETPFNIIEINKFADECAKVNDDLMGVLCACKDLLSSEIANHIMNHSIEECEPLLKTLAERFSVVSSYREVADCKINSSMLAETTDIVLKIGEFRNKKEECQP